MTLPISKRSPIRWERSLIDDAITGPIAEDGSFALELSSAYDWLLMLIDSTQPRHEQIVAFLGLENNEQVLLRTPTEGIQGDVDAGDAITVDGDLSYQQGTMLTYQTIPSCVS